MRTPSVVSEYQSYPKAIPLHTTLGQYKTEGVRGFKMLRKIFDRGPVTVQAARSCVGAVRRLR